MPRYQTAKPFDIVKTIMDLHSSVKQLQVQAGAGNPGPWITIPLATNWSTLSGQVVPSFRLFDNWTVEIVGAAQFNTTFSSAIALSSSNMDTIYRPKGQLYIAAGPGAAALAVNTDGSLLAAPAPGQTTQFCNFTGRYPRDLQGAP